VNVHDVGAEEHINFIVMEYIDGKNIKENNKGKCKLSSVKTVDIVYQVAKAL